MTSGGAAAAARASTEHLAGASDTSIDAAAAAAKQNQQAITAAAAAAASAAAAGGDSGADGQPVVLPPKPEVPLTQALRVPWQPLLTAEEVQRGLAYYGSGQRMERVAEKLLAGKPIKVCAPCPPGRDGRAVVLHAPLLQRHALLLPHVCLSLSAVLSFRYGRQRPTSLPA